MRIYTKYAKNDNEIINDFNVLENRNSSPKEYSEALYNIGIKLSKHIRNYVSFTDNVVFSCTNEDADYLGKAFIENLKQKSNIRLAIFWNYRTQAFGDKDLTIAPIVKQYIEQIEECDTLIICKSIIYTSCVVRTNLTYLINKINPKKIIIVAPVIYDKAEEFLNKEFDPQISSKFKYLYFAKDNEVNAQGEVIPGIGGNIYNRLGFKDGEDKNKYIPNIVKVRREKNYG